MQLNEQFCDYMLVTNENMPLSRQIVYYQGK